MARNARSRARRILLQAMYQWQLTGQDVAEVEAQFVEEGSTKGLDADYFHTLVHDITSNVDALDDALTPSLDRPIARLDPIERAILRIGAFELTFRKDVPWRVVINEAVELAKTFGAEQSHKYINGVLDKVARTTRADEIEARS